MRCRVLVIRTYRKKGIKKIKTLKQTLLIIAPILVFSPRVLRIAFNMKLPKPLTLGMIIFGMILIGISMGLKDKNNM
ncbi:hypothetical protein FDB52_12485 [Clostridium botulinum]|uniref:hypothetical protein n=1 Tax=Clostridium botulinum TaxID=1491 RepID=UPI0013CDA1C8|nr:hypothetical protein [Clostridium botulinum]MBN1042803.1 hypothetical protein [Clostridium botulinum]MBY6915716.1 hypothetical protein [Clostridium botulinum]NFN18513.1 hypothetical protein [Clostridium botulinum]NFN49342.1 hypothetical protein [Clostridium botulinum]NFO41463.1 hypothetical protein [Clostridium botulinum]